MLPASPGVALDPRYFVMASSIVLKGYSFSRPNTGLILTCFKGHGFSRADRDLTVLWR